MGKRPDLLVTNGELAGKTFSVGAGGLRLGRSSSNDIHIADGELSRNHCLFEAVGDDVVRLTDLASANGTILNGRVLGSEPADLKVGDVINVGSTVIKVVAEADAAPVVDLGLGAAAEGAGESAAAEPKKRSMLVNVLWAFAVLAAAAAIAVVLLAPAPAPESAPAAVQAAEPVLEEAWYEKVDATQDGIFRYELAYSPDGRLSVVVDDVPAENRHLTKSQMLDDRAKAELAEILDFNAVREIDREYVGVEPDPPALLSWTLRAVYSTRAKTIRIVNIQEPAPFRAIREKLEAFSKNQLGVWALQYSRDKLVELAEEAVRIGQSKWEDREVQHGNLFGAVAAFKEALFYLETVNPKPECAETARQGLENSQAELERRYADQRFLANRAINLGEWDTARRELLVLLEMVPDRTDDRNREATAKLIDVEKRLKGGK